MLCTWGRRPVQPAAGPPQTRPRAQVRPFSTPLWPRAMAGHRASHNIFVLF
jgi:hypothetical protein